MSSVEPSDADAGGETADKASDEGTKSDDSSERDPDAEPLLVIDDLRKSFGGLVAVDGASFSVDRGTITGLVGPNGAGKSTTLRIVSTLLNADDGSVTVAGAYRDTEPNVVREAVRYLPEEAGAYENLTGRGYL